MELTALGSDSLLPALDRAWIFLEHIGNSFRCQTILRQLGCLCIFLETPMFPKQLGIGRFGKAMLALRTIERLAWGGVSARRVRAILRDGIVCRLINLLYVSTSFLWWQAVAGIIGVKLSNVLRINARRKWRHRESSRNVHNTAIHHALSPSHHCGSVTAGVHG